jgi:hypothetical protein
VAGNHQVLVGLDYIGGYAAMRPADALRIRVVGRLVKLDPHSLACTADRGPHRCRILPDSGSEDDPIKAAQRRRERADVASDAIAEHVDRKVRAWVLAGKEFAEIGEIPESPSMPERR